MKGWTDYFIQYANPLYMRRILFCALLGMLCCQSIYAASSNLVAVFDQAKKAVKLSWQNNDATVIRFILQRSADNIHWVDLYQADQQKLADKSVMKYTDRFPDMAKNYYRLKIITNQTGQLYSETIMVIMGNAKESWVMYPVPVGAVLNLQYTGSEQIRGIVSVFIQSSQGKILGRYRFSSLTRLISMPVTNLGKGLYDVRILVGNDIVWNQRFIK